ncbi:alpha/beta hydrolase [Oleiagrimonas soli]|uniref:Alpha-beta hydrolase superfamily lysophospholipase n=1 Tax=Oleiagrimonas soli TaxID=1543381 RepID=A0A099CTL1_9GAMM|nr:alpha/beta hydrolase [Oleiagrimonas soli]KGI77099.1 alpha/beta hydrolase [Oleiagrimonas soli]MBB6185367.1 alpha-beta hydrolase superfamily lysophospholipase [Oleiagrimonas soli]
MTNALRADPLPGPEGQFDHVSMADGQSLFRRRWADPSARRGVLLVHGLGEHSGRYRHIAAWFAGRGWDVCSYDQRGHGRSPGPRGALRRGDDLLDDLTAMYAAYAAEFDTPSLLFGHSMGGLIVARAVLEGRFKPTAMVLSSPAFRSHESVFMQRLASVLTGMTPNLPLRNGLKRAYLSHDPSVAAFYGEDPNCDNRITPRLADFIFRAGAYCLAEADDLSVPTLLMAAGDDHLVDASGSRDFIAAAPPSKLDGRILGGLYHEIFNEAEPARSRVFAQLGEWLDEQFAEDATASE